MYPRKYYRRGGKYSNETCCINVDVTTQLNAGTTFPTVAEPNPDLGQIPKGALVVPSTTIMGNRKVKNFTLNISAIGNESSIVGALVYVPQGTTPGNLSVTSSSASLYEPNQNVIATFLIPPTCDRAPNGVLITASQPATIRLSNKLARNLSSGDMIVLVFASPDGVNAGDGTNTSEATGFSNDPLVINATVNYAIKY